MKFVRIAAFLAVGFPFSSWSAPVVVAPNGVHLGWTGEIFCAPVLTYPSVYSYVCVAGWLTPNLGLAGWVAPVGQFTGYRDDGTPLSYLDLIPLTTSSVTVVNAAGERVFAADSEGTVIAGKVTMTEPQGDISMGIYQ